MDAALLALKLTLLLLICCVGPGLLIVRRLRWSPMEKLCGAFAASFIVIYLVSFLLFTINAAPWAYDAATGIFALAGLTAWRTARFLLRQRRTRTALLAFGLLLVWYGWHLAMVRNYSGGDWQGDWREHYQRTEYFAGKLPNDFLFLGVYALPARPPLMNVIAAFFCRQVGMRFEAFSLVFLFLNAWAFLPCCLLLTLFRRRAARFIPLLAILFMLNPSIVQNATLTVTKAMTAGWVVLGVYFYLRGRISASAVSLAAGMLAHFSAVPYAMAIALHCVYRVMTRRQSPGRALVAAASGAALLATWFVWSIVVFGPRVTFLSNTTVTGTAPHSLTDNAHKVLHNLLTSLVPHPLHPVHSKPFSPPQNWSDVRDYYFMMAQTTLPMMIGLAGGIVAIWLVVRFLFLSSRLDPGIKNFWRFLLIFTLLVGVAVNPNWHDYGLAFVTLQPLALMGVTLVAAWLPTFRPLIFRLVLAGLAVDYAFGILLEFDRESYIYPTTLNAAGQTIMLPDPTLGGTGAQEYLEKLWAGYTFWGDHMAGFSTTLELLSLAGAVCAVWFLARRSTRLPLN